MSADESASPGGEEVLTTPNRRKQLGTRLAEYVPATTAVVNLIAIVGVCGGLYQFMDQGAGKRTEQSIQLVNVWETDKYKDKYERIQSEISKILDGLPADQKAFLTSSQDYSRVAAYGNIGRRAVTLDDQKMTDDIEDLFYYFNKTAICIEYSMCSKSASDAFLFETAKSFWVYFSWYARDRRDRGYESFASEAEKFATGQLRPRWYSLFD